MRPQDKYQIYMLTEILMGGELFTYLRQRKYLPEDQARFYAACVASAFAYMHGMDVCYRDLKPENLMFDDQGYMKVPPPQSSVERREEAEAAGNGVTVVLPSYACQPYYCACDDAAFPS